MKLWHLIIVNSECSLSPLCWPLFNIVTQKQKGRFDFSYWTSDPSLDLGDCGVVFLCRKVEDAKFLQQHPFSPSLLWLQPYVVSEWPHWLGMWTQNSHLISQFFFFFYCRIQICKKQKNNNYYSKSFWNPLHAKPFASIHTETPVYSKKKNKYFVPLAELTEYSHVACRLCRTNAFCLSLLLLSLSLPHFLIHPLPLPLCFTLLWGVLIDGSALSEDLVDGPWRIGLELL